MPRVPFPAASSAKERVDRAGRELVTRPWSVRADWRMGRSGGHAHNLPGRVAPLVTPSCRQVARALELRGGGLARCTEPPGLRGASRNSVGWPAARRLPLSIGKNRKDGHAPSKPVPPETLPPAGAHDRQVPRRWQRVAGWHRVAASTSPPVHGASDSFVDASCG